MKSPGAAVLRHAFLFVLLTCLASAQPFVRKVSQLDAPEFAEWIGPRETQGTDVFLFRKRFNLATVPAHFVVHVSADHRYRLFVNGRAVSSGPAAADPSRWNYDTLDLAQWLKAGTNVVAAQVARIESRGGPPRQVSQQLAFIIQGDQSHTRVLNTDASWRVMPELAHTTLTHTRETAGGGYIAGGTDRIDGRRYPWGWTSGAFDDSAWEPATPFGKGNHQGLNTWLGTPWLLRPSGIPQMEEREDTPGAVVDAKGIAEWTPEDLTKRAVTIPARSKAEFLIDHGTLTMGIPTLVLSRGRDAVVRLQYQESLFQPDGKKGNRNEWRGKTMKGIHDEFVADGGERREFAPLWLRVFRFMKVTVETSDEPLVIDALSHRFVAYPFEQKARFTSAEPKLAAIWDASWRTARLCAHETYMDCPYYEQLQYIGDTRIQALISYYVTGDTRLARQAIEAFQASIQPMGLTKSSHPCAGVQIIPPFSLVYVLMLHDALKLTPDTDFLRDKVSGARFILDWFLQRIDPTTGLLGPLPFWNHVDGGTPEFIVGSPPGIEEGGSAHLSLLLALTLDRAAELVALDARPGEAEFYRARAAALKDAARRHCWNAEKGLFAESPRGTLFTTHTNSIAILADAVPGDAQAVARKIVSDRSLAQPTLYFDFYVFEALAHAGVGDLILPRLDRWTEFLGHGLTTFPEHHVESRSDCHAWSAHPMYGLLAITAGVRSEANTFAAIAIKPSPGALTEFTSEMPHPQGTIGVSYRRSEGAERYEVKVPAGVVARFERGAVKQPLKAGTNVIVVPVGPSSR